MEARAHGSSDQDTRNRQAEITALMESVRRIAQSFKRRLPASIDLEDLIGAGALGLAQALDSAEGKEHTCFEAYALRRIRGAILDELRRLDPLSRVYRDRAKRLAKTERTLTRRLGRAPEPSEVARELGISADELASLRKSTSYCETHLDLDRVDLSVACAAPPADELLEHHQQSARLQQAIDRLPDGMYRVIRLHCEDHNLAQIGQQLGVSESRVCQVRSEAVRLLRATMTASDTLSAAA